MIPALPLAGFVLLVLFGRRLGKPAAGSLATLLCGAAFAVSVAVFFALLHRPAEHRAFSQHLYTWFRSGGLEVRAGLLVDQLSITMALFVTGVGTLIHLYSIGYMKEDDNFSKFFLYLNLFAFSMLVLVLGDSLLTTFLGWEGVGACSYFLVSFWFERPAAATAGKKAFVTNRVGDFGFMIAMFLAFGALGTLQYGGAGGLLARAGALSPTTAAAIALLLFLGACGKSAQLPLYIWLPDAMEGPTPVSALIHAATMVTAGVYLMCRINPILARSPAALDTVAWVGAATALFAATIACAQSDIKRVLAYSTISQLGYMFLAVGSGAYVAGVFHMVTHAFFKALLFLGAGSVIHGIHDEQDMRKMGGLQRFMPITSATFIVGWLAIAGVPPFAGFWSKDDILANAWDKSPALWAIGIVTALLTAYYMTRQVVLVFFGDERWRQVTHGDPGEAAAGEPTSPTGGEAGSPAASEATPPAQEVGHDPATPHEAPWTMALPLVALALLATVGGALNLPFSRRSEFLGRWLEPVFGSRLHELGLNGSNQVAFAGTAVVLAVIGGTFAWLVYLRHRVRAERMEPAVLRRGWYVNDLVSAFVDTPVRLFAAFCAFVVDLTVIDGAVNGMGALVRTGGARLRRVQSGYVRQYALGVTAGAVLVLGYLLSRVGGG
ncbi:MAG: NADH-quinone oxidoreductase subunit L [Acidimicrobiales bacterium]